MTVKVREPTWTLASTQTCEQAIAPSETVTRSTELSTVPQPGVLDEMLYTTVSTPAYVVILVPSSKKTVKLKPDDVGFPKGACDAKSFVGVMSVSTTTKVTLVGIGGFTYMGTPAVTISFPHLTKVAVTASSMHSRTALGATATIQCSPAGFGIVRPEVVVSDPPGRVQTTLDEFDDVFVCRPDTSSL